MAEPEQTAKPALPPFVIPENDRVEFEAWKSKQTEIPPGTTEEKLYRFFEWRRNLDKQRENERAMTEVSKELPKTESVFSESTFSNNDVTRITLKKIKYQKDRETIIQRSEIQDLILGACLGDGERVPQYAKALKDCAIINSRCDKPLSEDELTYAVLNGLNTVSDYYEGGKKRSLKSIGEKKEPIAYSFDNTRTQITMSDMFVKKYSGEWIYNNNSKIWMHWNGKLWETDRQSKIRNVVQEFLKDYLNTITQRCGGKEALDEITFVIRLNTARGVRDILELAQTRMSKGIDEFNVNPRFFNCQNGEYDLIEGKLIPHNKEHYLSKISTVTYDNTKDCPLWKKHISTVCENNEDLERNLQEILGYSLQGLNPNEIFSIFTGSGRNGKSVSARTIQNLYGDYAISVNPSCLMEAGDRAGSERIDMFGARLIVASEPSKTPKESRCSLDTGFIKTATGNDTTTARELYCKGIRFKITGLVLILTNELPKINDVSTALWDRIWVFPFVHYFSDDDRDANIEQELLSEKSGIFNWLLEGYRRYKVTNAGKLKQCEAVRSETEDYRGNEDWLMPFTSTLNVSDPQSEISSGSLYTNYTSWYETNYPGRPEKILKQKKFSSEMKKRFRTKHTKNGTYFIGIRDPLQKSVDQNQPVTPAWSQQEP